MPKKGGKRLADIDGQPAGEGEGEGSEETPVAEAAEAEAGEKVEAKQGQIEPKGQPEVVTESKKEAPSEITPEAAPAPAAAAATAAAAAAPPAAPKPVLAPQSQRQKQAAAAWEQQNKSAEKFYANVFQGVEKDVQSVNSSLQANLTSAQDTLRNVSVANRLLLQISESLRSVDTLVVPIVLQRDGNF